MTSQNTYWFLFLVAAPIPNLQLQNIISQGKPPSFTYFTSLGINQDDAGV